MVTLGQKAQLVIKVIKVIKAQPELKVQPGYKEYPVIVVIKASRGYKVH